MRSRSIACWTSQNLEMDFRLWKDYLACLTHHIRGMDFCIERSGVYCFPSHIGFINSSLQFSGLASSTSELEVWKPDYYYRHSKKY